MTRPDSVRSRGASIRCAIYTRKSSDEGLEQEFNSLDAQREACEAYIVSQRHAGWVGLSEMYDDGGLSGGTMERPALKRLLEDVRARKVQIIVVYKVDRLTRSLADFAKIVDILDAHNASFVSVTQQFNTTTSMGRLTLNMLLSFAQFEREIAGERIRDKIAASKRKGMWMGGNVPLGYDVKDRKLIVNEEVAATVRTIFRRYAELGSVTLLKSELDRQGVVSKRRAGAGGCLAGGKPFSRGALYLMLQNRIYRGEIVHQAAAYPGQHDAIIDPDLWQVVQHSLAANRHDRSLSAGAESPSLLAGLIYDADGRRMTPTHAVRKGKRYRYYVSAVLIRSDPNAPETRTYASSSVMRIPAGDAEALVLDQLRAFFSSTSAIADSLSALGLDAHDLETILRKATAHSRRWFEMSPIELTELVRDIVEHVTVHGEKIEISLNRGKIARVMVAEARIHRDDSEPLLLVTAAKLRRAGKGKRLVIESDAEPKIDQNLVALIREAFSRRTQLLIGPDGSIEAMIERLGIARGRLSSLVRLSYLAPDIIQAILAGRQPVELTPTRLLKLSRDLPHDWKGQRTFLGFAI
ncbi:recombinase family protein [Methylocystis sp. MitZ-2018]|nr:recombinase family protein [Methylocystis sp. MitZ-2018]